MANSRKRLQPGGGCLSLFGLPFLIAGVALVWFYFAGYAEWLKARTWVEVPCWIETAELEVNRGSDSTTYRAVATYRYDYEGRTYQGSKVAFGSGSDNIGTFQQDAHRELSSFLPGNGEPRPFRCFVNPSQPAESVVYRTFRWEMRSFLAIFVLVFPPVGVALVVGGLMSGRGAKKQAALRAKHPDEPWRWKKAWLGPEIPEVSVGWRKILYIYTIWSGLVIWPLILFCVMSGASVDGGSIWWILIYPALWAVPAWLCYKSYRRWISVGDVRFHQTEVPARTGSVLSGAILLRKPLPSRLDAKVELVCEKKITRPTQKGSSITTERVWSAEQVVPQDLVTRDLYAFRVPVSFHLPGDAPGTDMEMNAVEACQWRLHLSVPGSPIKATFDLPVFEGDKQTPSPSLVPTPSIRERAAEDLPSHLASRRIKAEFDGSGIPISLDSPPGRNRVAIFTLLFFNLIWTAAAVFLLQSNAPLIFKLVWPVSAAAIWIGIAWMALHGREVKVDQDGISVINRLGPYTWSIRIERSRVAGFSHDTNMTANETRFYRVRVEDVMGRKLTLVDGLTASVCAEDLEGRFQRWKSGS